MALFDTAVCLLRIATFTITRRLDDRAARHHEWLKWRLSSATEKNPESRNSNCDAPLNMRHHVRIGRLTKQIILPLPSLTDGNRVASSLRFGPSHSQGDSPQTYL
ncbi:hypothetical protein TRVL_06702 [Trypanosoma vivax]|nr:hypothetical protein TRVL_06702 [Trypanosoma vivax]